MTVFKKIILKDSYQDEIQGTLLSQMKIAESYRLSGGVFNGVTLDTNYFTSRTANGGSVSVSNSECSVSVTTTSGSSAGIYGNSVGRFMSANMNYFRTVRRTDNTGSANNIRRLGVCDIIPSVGTIAINNGFFFQLNGTTGQVVARKGGVDTVVSSGSLNGDGTQSNLTFTVDTNYHTYEIFYTSRKVIFAVDNIPIHTMTTTTTSMSATRHFHPFMDNTNTSTGTAVSSSCMSITVNRYGAPVSQPKSYYQSGTTAGVNLKQGPGTIHSLHISNVTNLANVILYDNTAASGTILYSTGSMSNNLVPFDVKFDGTGGIPFETGLELVISGANCNCVVLYE